MLKLPRPHDRCRHGRLVKKPSDAQSRRADAERCGARLVPLHLRPPSAHDRVGVCTATTGVPVLVSSLAGARRRLEEIYLERADAVIVSAAAFAKHQDDFPGLAAVALGDSTFYSAGSLVVVERPGEHAGGRIRVGIDRASHDHQLLTETEFAGQDVEFVDARFVTGPAAVLRGRVDAAIWHSMPTVISPQLAGLQVRPVSDATLDKTRDVSRAVLVTRSLDPAASALMRDITPATIARTQNRLLRLAAEAEDT
nr:YhfZ family protein [uncultured Microbacterium sp.]